MTSLKARVRQLEEERKTGPMPNRCHNTSCRTIRYGEGYTCCPGCGASTTTIAAGCPPPESSRAE